MSRYDETLLQLRAQADRKRQLEVMLTELRRRREELSRRLPELEEMKCSQEADVKRLEGRSLSAFFYNVIGKMDEALTREREEAYAARVKYDAAVRELAAVEEDLERREAERRQLLGSEERYAQALAEKADALKKAGGPAAEELLRLEEKLAGLQHRQKELKEAVEAGRAALGTADEVLAALDSAGDWATVDLFGGGLVTDLIKHDHLDEAQGLVEQLQVELGRFRTELADVEIRSDLKVNIDGFLRFADYFFDGLFVDLAVMDRIENAQQQVEETRNQIESVLRSLEDMEAETDQDRRTLEDRLDQLLCETASPHLG